MSLFDETASHLEELTSLSRLEARGTLRLALKEAGLEPEGLTGRQLRVVLEKVLPKELGLRGIQEGDPICASLAERVRAGEPEEGQANRADAVDSAFGRMGS